MSIRPDIRGAAASSGICPDLDTVGPFVQAEEATVIDQHPLFSPTDGSPDHESHVGSAPLEVETPASASEESPVRPSESALAEAPEPPVELSGPPSARSEEELRLPETNWPSIEEPTAEDAPKTFWSEPTPRRRQLPKRAVIAAAVAVGLVLIPLVFMRGSGRPQHPHSEKAHEELIINEKDLKNRRQVAADDFRPRHFGHAAGPIASSPAQGIAPALDAAKTGEATSLAERRKRRADDPEDLISHRGRTSKEKKNAAQAEAESGGYRRPSVYFEPRGADSRGRGSHAPVVQAGSTVAAVLSTPIEIHGGGSQTALARTDSDGPLPKGSRFLGTAVSDGDGRVSVRFSRLVLPDGAEAKIDAEAQDSNGSFRLGGSAAPESEDTGHSVAGDIARDTAGDVASEALSTVTGGLGSRLARRALYRTSPNPYSGHSNRSVSLGQGQAFQIFFHQAVVLHTPDEKGERHAL